MAVEPEGRVVGQFETDPLPAIGLRVYSFRFNRCASRYSEAANDGHLSRSIRRCEATIWSKAGSGVHFPTKSEKSAFRGRPIAARVNSSTMS